MPRNSSGVYQLPAGNPVVTGTLIESGWANSTMIDIAQALTDSLDRFGRSTMAAPLLANDGTLAAPGLSFGAESSTGLFRKAAKVLGVAVGGQEIATFTQAGITLPKGIVGALALTGGLTLGDGASITAKGATGGSWTVAPVAATGGAALKGQGTTSSWIDLDAIPSDGVTPGTDASQVRIYRNVNTSGVRSTSIYRGDGSSTVDHRFFSLAAPGLGAEISRGGQRTLIGNPTDDGTSNCQIAGITRINGAAYGQLGVREGTYGGTGPWVLRDGIVLETSGNTGISILSPNTFGAGLIFGDPESSSIGQVAYDHTTDQMTLIAAGATKLYVDAAYVRATVPWYAGNDTAAAPGYSYTTDPDTGMFRGGVNILGFATAGVEKMRIPATADATLQIGTSSATNIAAGRAMIEVNGAVGSLLMMGVAGVGSAYLNVYSTQFDIHAVGASRALTFGTNSAERGRFTTAGDFLVGLTSSQIAGANAGIIDVSGSQFASIGVSVAGVIKGYLTTNGTRLKLNSQNTLEFAIGDAAKAIIDAAGTFTYAGEEIGWRSIPHVLKTANYTVTTADRGKCMRADSPTTLINFPGSGFAAGDVITVYNNTGVITIGAVSGLSLRWGTGSYATGNRTLAPNGVATIMFITATVAVVTGTGLS